MQFETSAAVVNAWRRRRISFNVKFETTFLVPFSRFPIFSFVFVKRGFPRFRICAKFAIKQQQRMQFDRLNMGRHAVKTSQVPIRSPRTLRRTHTGSSTPDSRRRVESRSRYLPCLCCTGIIPKTKVSHATAQEMLANDLTFTDKSR